MSDDSEAQAEAMGRDLGPGFSGMGGDAPPFRNCPNLTCPQGVEMCRSVGCAAYVNTVNELPSRIGLLEKEIVRDYIKGQIVVGGVAIAEFSIAPNATAGDVITIPRFSFTLV